ncbi:MAG: glycosyltransferase family 2 protein [Candidatus Melainabacteria bacterium]
MTMATLNPPAEQGMPQAAGLSVWPLISVVTPVYNAAGTIVRTLQSAIRQTYPHKEIILVIDGSPDDSLARIRAYLDSAPTPPGCTVMVIEQANQGSGAARNAGMKAAHGEFIALLDSDDIWADDKLMLDYRTWQTRSDPQTFIYSSYYAVDDDFSLVKIHPITRDEGHIVASVISRESLVLPSTSFFPKSLLSTMGDFPLNCPGREDWMFFIRMALQFPGCATGHRSTLYRQSLSGQGRCAVSNYEAALEKNWRMDDALASLMTPEIYTIFETRRKNNTLFTFLMYNYTDFAKRYYQENRAHFTLRELAGTTKGRLALLSLYTGINLLFASRLIYQVATRSILAPWWKAKMNRSFGAMTV